MKLRHNFLLGLLVILLTSACGRKEQSDYSQAQGAVWNTLYHISYDGPRHLADSVIIVLKDLEKSVSVFDSASLISKINNNVSDSLDSHLRKLLTVSQQIHAQTGGAFDPSASPLFEAWGFGRNHEAGSDTLALDSLMEFIGMDKISINGSRIVKSDPRIQFNLSSIAKGYGCDCVAAMLKRNGVDNFIVEIGGEVVASGKSPRGDVWNIAIDSPERDAAPAENAASIVSFTDGAVATSGNYRNYHEQGGQRFGHTINPTTGHPVQTDILSATVAAPTAMQADAYATAFMVVGSKRAKELADSLGIGIFLILADSTTLTNKAFDRYLVK